MANKSLTDLTALTTTADSDLVHVNRGGTDYKQEKIDFMNGNLSVAFSFSSLLTAQVDSMDLSKTCFGYLWNYGHVSTSGVPINNLCYIKAVTTNSNLYSCIEAWSATDPDGQHYIVCKNNGTWESSWTKCASKAEITSLNNSLTNSLTCDTIFDHKNIPSTATQYSCNWQNYNFLIIQAVQYGNKRANIFIPYASFYGTSSGNRPQIYDPLAQCTYEVYQNGSGKIYASCNAPTSAIGLVIYGLAKR